MTIDYMRRCDVNRMIPAELAVHEAMVQVERLEADERLTNAIVLLEQARTQISDWADATGNIKPDLVAA